MRQSLKPKDRFAILKRDKFRCRYCGADGSEETLHVDHVHAVALGGTNHHLNLVTACAQCNRSKKDQEWDWVPCCGTINDNDEPNNHENWKPGADVWQGYIYLENNIDTSTRYVWDEWYARLKARIAPREQATLNELRMVDIDLMEKTAAILNYLGDDGVGSESCVLRRNQNRSEVEHYTTASVGLTCECQP